MGNVRDSSCEQTAGGATWKKGVHLGGLGDGQRGREDLRPTTNELHEIGKGFFLTAPTQERSPADTLIRPCETLGRACMEAHPGFSPAEAVR